MTSSKHRLWILMALLALQAAVWILLILTVPRLNQKHAYSDFSVHPDQNCACMVLRLSGSHVWGLPVSDAFCIDLETGKLNRMLIAVHDAMREVAEVARSKRSMRWAPDGKVQIVTHDPASAGGLRVQSTDFPQSKGPALIDQRYLLGVDDDHFYLWDAENPEAGTRQFPTTLESLTYFNPIPDIDLAYVLLPAKPIKPASNPPAKPAPSGAAGKSLLQDPFGGSNVIVNADPFGGSNPFGPSQTRTLVQPLQLFHIDEVNGPQLVAQWDVLVPDRFAVSGVVTSVDRTVVSLAPEGDAFEYRSMETGNLIRRQPILPDFDAGTMDWAFDHGRIHLGSRNQGPLFDLRSDSWVPSPGKEWRLHEEDRETGLAIYRSKVDEGQVVFDHRQGRVLLEIPQNEGTPLFMDDDTVAICSTRCGFAVDVVDLRTGSKLVSWTPWWWAKWLLFASLAAYACWSVAWMKTAASAHHHPLLDVLLVLGSVVAVLAFRCTWVDVSGIDHSVLEQAVRGIGCAVLTLAGCGLFVGKGRWLPRFLIVCFVFAGVVALSRLLLDAEYEHANADGSRVMVASYYDTVQGLSSVMISAVVGMTLCLVLVGCRFRIGVAVETTVDTDRQMTWRTVDLCLLIAAVAVLITVCSPLAPHVREEISDLASNDFYSWQWKNLAAIGPLTVAMAIATLARRSVWFGLAGLLAVLAVFYVGWEPIAQFVMHTPDVISGPDDDHHHVAASSAAAAWVACLPYRQRNWRITPRRKPSS